MLAKSDNVVMFPLQKTSFQAFYSGSFADLSEWARRAMDSATLYVDQHLMQGKEHASDEENTNYTITVTVERRHDSFESANRVSS